MRSEDWREAFAVAYSGSALYGDDGELQDNATKPFIDYRKDSAAEIGRKIRERQAAKDWLPIESAPKDGTAILVMRNDWPGCPNGVAEKCKGHNTYVAAWWAEEGSGQGAWICYMNAVLDPECPITPTHWMPLPEPPAPKGQQHAK